MGYRNKTYVIFDGDNDMWAYGRMKGWKGLTNIDFNFFDAHDLNELRDGALEPTVKRALKVRLANTKQAVVLIGESTRYLYRYVRWELESCLDLGIPIVAVNLNGKRRMDQELCPPILHDRCVVHIPFRMRAIQHALDDFCEHYDDYMAKCKVDLFYPGALYERLGID